MTLQMNTAGLLQNGYRLIAMYEFYKKGLKKFNVECWQGDGEYLVKHWESGRRSFTHVYKDKAQANAKFVELKKMYSFAKRVR